MHLPQEGETVDSARTSTAVPTVNHLDQSVVEARDPYDLLESGRDKLRKQ